MIVTFDYRSNAFATFRLLNRLIARMNSFDNIRIEPPLERWSDWVSIFEIENSRLHQLRQEARRRLVDAAQSYLLKLNSIAEDAGLSENTAQILTGDPETQPIVMTGHQPVIFHPGLAFKYQIAEKVAADCNAIAVSVSIDTDRGDSGQFTYAQHSGDADEFPVCREVETIASSHNLYVHGRLRTSAELEVTATEVLKNLTRLSSPVSNEMATEAFSAYEKLAVAKCSSAEANTIVRSMKGIGGRLLEIPLSAIASFPEALTLTADILKQSQRFVSVYNSTLALFREEHGIRNAANPFPSLKIEGERCELPFWLVDHDNRVRHVLEVEHDGDVTRLIANNQTIDTFTGSISSEALEPLLLQNIQLVPRGALITAFLRLLFSDLFVHGVGGARYDQFTDEFIRTWWNCEPPAFTLATASRFAFPQQKLELARLQELKDNVRDMQFNPQRYFGKDVFSTDLETELRSLSEQKLNLVAQLKEAKSQGQPASEFGQQIQQMTEQIKTAVTGFFKEKLQRLERLTPEQIDTINSRTYPWFFFEPASVDAI